MALSPAQFTAYMDDWCATVAERLVEVPQLACDNISNSIIGSTPVGLLGGESFKDLNGNSFDIGRLRHSWWPALGASSSSVSNELSSTGHEDIEDAGETDTTAVASSSMNAPSPESITQHMQLGETYNLTNSQPYAFRIEYGFVGSDSLGRHYHQTGHYMVNNAAAKWDYYVELAVEEVLSGAGPIGGVEEAPTINLSDKIEGFLSGPGRRPPDSNSPEYIRMMRRKGMDRAGRRLLTVKQAGFGNPHTVFAGEKRAEAKSRQKLGELTKNSTTTTGRGEKT